MKRQDPTTQQVIIPYTQEDLIRPYNHDAKFSTFTDLDSRITEYYDEIYDTVISHSSRQSGRYVYELGIKIGFRDIFYALDLLYENNPQSVVDLGSSNCFWKNWFPNIFAVDNLPARYIQPDLIAEVDHAWCEQNAGRFDAGINICGAQDGTLLISNFVRDQMLVVKDRCLFTISRQNQRIGPSPSYEYNLHYMIQQIFELGEEFDLIMLDVPAFRGIRMYELDRYSHINGSVRFMLAHRKQNNT